MAARDHDRDTYIARRPLVTTMVIVFTSVVGGGILGLPVALAAFGPRWAALIVVGFGAINVVTIGALARSVSRSLPLPRDDAGIGSFVVHHLGSGIGRAVQVIALVGSLGLLVVYLVGLSGTLSDIVGLPEAVWVALAAAMAAIAVAADLRDFLARSGTAVAAITVLLLLALMTIMAATAMHQGALPAPPADALHDPAVWQGVVGVCFFVLFGHTAVLVVGPRVLHADPTGRLLVRGSCTAMAVAVAFNAAWVFLALLVLPRQAIEGAMSTGVSLYATTCGPWFTALGLALVVIAFGFSVLNYGFFLSDVSRGIVRTSTTRVFALAPGDSFRLSDSRSGTTLTATRVPGTPGLTTSVQRGRHHVSLAGIALPWSAQDLLTHVRAPASLFASFDDDGTHGDLHLVLVRSSLRAATAPHHASGAASLADSTASASLLAAVIRGHHTVAVAATAAGLHPAQAAAALDILCTRGLISVEPDGSLRPVLGLRRSVAAELIDPWDPAAVAVSPTRQRDHSATQRVLGFAPIVLAALITVVVNIAHVSYAEAIGFVGVIYQMTVGSLVPPLLVLALRRRAERIVAPSRVLDSAWLAGFIMGLVIALSLSAAALGGPIAVRTAEVGSAAFGVAMLVVAWRGGRLRPRSTLSLEVTHDGRVTASALDAGHAVAADCPAVLPPVGEHLTVQVPSGLTSPVLLAASTGSRSTGTSLPAHLGPWTVTNSVDRHESGHLDSVQGQQVTVSAGPVEVRFQVV